MLNWFKKLFQSPNEKQNVPWHNLLPGDYVRIRLKDPKSVGIISTTESLTHQRLDAEDIRTRQIDGFVVRTECHGIKPARIDMLELNVVKKKGITTKLVTYLLLREEIEYVNFIEDKKHE